MFAFRLLFYFSLINICRVLSLFLLYVILQMVDYWQSTYNVDFDKPSIGVINVKNVRFYTKYFGKYKVFICLKCVS